MSRRRRNPASTPRTALLAASWLLLSTAIVGCSGAPPVDLGPASVDAAAEPGAPAAASPAERVPVVLVPGLTGSELVDRRTGETIWGLGRHVLRPRDGGYALARPLSDPVDGPATDVVAGEPIAALSIGPFHQGVYGPLLAALAAAGYLRGDLDSPAPGDTLFTHGYDWRSDNVLAAGELRRRLDALADLRGEGYAVDLVCQSNGAHICRYLLKYGGAPLEDAEAGDAGPPTRFTVRKVVLVGTSNGGALRILREIERGRKYVPIVGRVMRPEVLFTFPSLFQDLPAHRRRPFVDPEGRPLDLDLFDADVWLRRGLTIFGGEAAARMDRRPDLFGTAADREAYLRAALDRALRLHALLAADVPGFPSPRYYLVQNRDAATPHLAVIGLVPDRLSFTGDPELEDRRDLAAAVTRPGDGHATVASQRSLSPQELASIAAPDFHVDGKHFELILHPATLRRIVEVLAD